MIQKVKEKPKPHYLLNVLKELFRSEKTRHITRRAHEGAVNMGYMDDDAMLAVVEKLCPEHFYKSMTSYGNYKVWQDVYRYQDGEKSLYIKLQLSADGQEAVLIQMKRDEGRDE